MLVQRLLALRTTLHRLVQHLLGAHGTRVEARVAQEVPEVPVVRAVEVNLLDLGLHALRVIPAEHDHLNPVEEANKPVHETVRLQRLQLPDREEVVVVVGVDEMGTISVMQPSHGYLPNITFGDDAKYRGFFANMTGSASRASVVDVMPRLM